MLMVVNDPAFFLSHRLPVALAAREAGWQVGIVTPEGEAVSAIRAHGLDHHYAPLTNAGLRPDHQLAAFLTLHRLYRELKPDLVHHVTIKPVLYGGLAARMARVPAVVAAVSGLGYVFTADDMRARLIRPPVHALYREALNHPNACVIVQNPDNLARLEAIGALSRARVELIPGSGVCLATFQPRPEPQDGPPMVLFASRMLREKGVEVFIEAARLLKRRGVSARFVLAGGTHPNPTSLTRAELSALNAEGIVEWLGPRSDMTELMAGSAMVCLPSWYGEGVPKVLLEAAAAGRPVITTDWPGCIDAIEPGATGLAVPPRDAGALADAMARLLADRELRERMGQAGRARAEALFSVDAVSQRHLAIYAELVEGAG